MKDNDLNLVNVYHLIIKNIKPIAAVCFINAVIASIILLLTPNSYRSYALFFPVSDIIADKATLLNEFTARATSQFGTENVTDKVYNITTSATVQNHAIQNQDLVNHYGYDTEKLKSYEKTAKRFGRKVRIRRTPYNSIEITAEDKDYNKAAAIIQDMLDKTEEIYHQFIMGSREEIAQNIENHIQTKDSVLNVWSQELAALRDQYHFYGVINPHRESATIPSLGSLNGEGFEKIQNLEEKKEKLLVDISQMRTLQNQILITGAQNTYMLNLIDKPVASPIKSGPKRTLTVILVVIFSFILMVALLIIRERNRSIKSENG